jgi:hypothetical protein
MPCGHINSWRWSKFLRNVRTLSKSHRHIVNVFITTVQSLKNVSLKVWKELITQSRYHKFKTCWKNDYRYVQLHVNILKNIETLLKSHMLIFNVSITTVQSLENISPKYSCVLPAWNRYNAIQYFYFQYPVQFIWHIQHISLCCGNTYMNRKGWIFFSTIHLYNPMDLFYIVSISNACVFC